MLTNQSIGYMDAPVPKDLDLKEAIDKLRKREECDYFGALLSKQGDIQRYSGLCGRQSGLGTMGG